MCSKGLFLPVGPCILPHLSQAMLLFRAVFAPGKPSEGWPGVGMDDAARPSCVLPAVRPGQVKQPLWCSAASSEKYGVGSPRVLPNPIQSVVVVVMTIMLTFLTVSTECALESRHCSYPGFFGSFPAGRNPSACSQRLMGG